MTATMVLEILACLVVAPVTTFLVLFSASMARGVVQDLKVGAAPFWGAMMCLFLAAAALLAACLGLYLVFVGILGVAP